MMGEVFGHVYVIENILDGKTYVGITTRPPRTRWTQHLSAARCGGGSKYLGRAMRLHGEDSFKHTVIDTADNIEMLHELERLYIKLFRSKSPHGYNLTDGGEGTHGYQWTEETRERQKIIMAERWADEEVIEATRQRTIAQFSVPENRGKHKEIKLKEFENPERVRQHLDAVARKVTAEWVEYDSIASAAAALGVSKSTIEKRILKEVPGYYGAEMKYKSKPGVPKRVMVNGVIYDSMRAADVALGVGIGTTSSRFKNKIAGYNFIDDDGNVVPMEHTGSIRKRPICVHGVIYPSAVEAEKSTGIKAPTLRARAKRGKSRKVYYVNDVDKEAA